MYRNEILEEVRRIRDEFAKRHDYDIDSMVAELQRMEQNHLTRVVDRRKQAQSETSKATPEHRD